MKTILTLCVCWLLCIQTYAQPAASKSSLNAASTLLALLDKDQLAKISYPYESEERSNWYFVPKDRNGLIFREMNEKQREAAMNLLKATLSEQGQQKAIAIMQLEIILKELENAPASSDYRNPLKYYFTIFGTPDPKKLWGWRIEGHHLSLNFTADLNKVVSGTPLFMGSNPGIVPSGEKKGYQILKDEVNLAFDLLASLSPEQLKKAIVLESAPNDILTSNKRKASSLTAEGITFAELNKDQQKQLMRIVSMYVNNYPLGFAKDFMEKIEKAGLDKLQFAWAGDKQWSTKGHYYRIQNDVLLIEYDNTQNNGNHIHTVVRDLTNDFGEDILKKHYEQDHAKK